MARHPWRFQLTGPGTAVEFLIVHVLYGEDIESRQQDLQKLKPDFEAQRTKLSTRF
eukprot:m.501714 g.501714  ORF g.501714 m.501714 type:complete len:56 (-) comp57333_c0_seq14:1582-1749(-)